MFLCQWSIVVLTKKTVKKVIAPYISLFLLSHVYCIAVYILLYISVSYEVQSTAKFCARN